MLDEEIIKFCNILQAEYVGESRIDGRHIIKITYFSLFEKYKKYLEYEEITQFGKVLVSEEKQHIIIKIYDINPIIFYLRKEKLERLLK